MLTTPKKIACISFLLLASACSQDQAPVDYRGKQFYGREHNGAGSSGNETYSRNSNDYSSHYKSGYSRPVDAASVPSVGISDLPPAQTGGKPAVNSGYGNSPFSTPPSKPLDSAISEQPVNTAPGTPPADTSSLVTKTVSERDGISLIWPVTGGKITAHFKGTANDGINISISEGEPIVAAASGTVVYSGNDLKDYGNMVILRHDNSWLTAYANTSRIVAKKGAYIKQGDIIAYVGSSGGVKTPQLHFTLRKGKVLVDPEKYLPQN